MNVLMLAPANCIHSLRPLNWLLERDCRVTLVDWQRPQLPPREGLSCARYPVARGMRFLTWLGRGAKDRLQRGWVSTRLRSLRRRTRTDVVHVHWIDKRAFDCAQAGLRPLVLTSWGSDINRFFQPGADEREREWVGRALAAADLTLVDSADMPDKCAALAGRPVPTAFLPLGIDTTLFRPAPAGVVASWRSRLGITDDAIVFMSVRAMAPLYGHHGILDAFARACRDSVRPLVLVFKVYNREYYSDGVRYEAALRERANELGVVDRIRWVSEVPYADLPALYSLADAVVNYPSMDGFPVTFLEAAACKCPVISVALPAYAGTFAEELFDLVPPDDIAALAAAMRAHADREKLGARVEAAREVVEREFDESVSAARLLEHYRRLARAGAKVRDEFEIALPTGNGAVTSVGATG